VLEPLPPPPSPPPPPPPTPRTRDGRRAIGVAVLVVFVAAAYLLGRARPPAFSLPPSSTSVLEVRPTPNVVVAVRQLARLETSSYHMERVIELADKQTHLFGLLDAKDALLLVAVADVTAGVDMEKLGDGDVSVDPVAKRVHLRVPAPEIFSVALDNGRTRVVSRTTDAFATRKESLEGEARAEAEASMRGAAVESGILERARAGTERALRDLLRALGFDAVEVEWKTE
jgi:hypothetical protein